MPDAGASGEGQVHQPDEQAGEDLRQPGGGPDVDRRDPESWIPTVQELRWNMYYGRWLI